ncbi:MCE family protein [Nonomuraea africana]|uniref:MCE family protein n=1 Tax=Nonomuraea africana TaxID=46171 RepID=UPI003400E653
MRPRIYLNLAFFALLGVVMTVWAFTTIIKLDVITQPYRVSAEFASSPGLVRGFDVAYLGVRVGRIGDVRLAPGKIVVGLDLDREVRLPRASTAEVRRKSAIGEPYVELSPPATGVGGPSLAPGDVIPLSRTTVPLDYKKLFAGVGRLLNAVPPQDAKTITHELAVALDGRAPSIRGIIDDAHDLTDTLADNSKTLDELAVQLTRLTGTLAGRREKLAAGITDLATVTGSLRESRKELNAFLDHGPGVFGQIDTLIRTARPGLSCALTAAGLPHKPVFSAETERNVNHMLSVVPTALSLADDISDKRPDGTVYGRTTFVFSIPGGPQPAEEYAGPIGPPKMAPLLECPKHAPVTTVDFTADKGPHPADATSPADREDPGHPADPGATSDRDKTAEPEDTSDRKKTAGPKDATGSEDTADPDGSSSGEAARTGTPEDDPATSSASSASTPQDLTPLIIAIVLAVVVSGGVLGWIAVGRSARRRGTE